MVRERSKTGKMVICGKGQDCQRNVDADKNRREHMFDAEKGKTAYCRIIQNIYIIVPVGESVVQGWQECNTGYDSD